MFSLSRTHVASVIASLRAICFHPTSSFGKTRTRRSTDLTGGLGICGNKGRHVQRSASSRGSGGCQLVPSMSVVNTTVSVIAISGMSCWLPRDLTTTPLDQIDAEIAEIQKRPPGKLNVNHGRLRLGV
jgi:hypothetical protein